MALKSEEIRVYIEKESMERIRELGKRLGFDGEEGIRYLNLNVDKKEEKSKTTVVLPFCGKIMKENCCGVKLNHGLYTQCTNEWSIVHTVNDEDVHLCKTCYKQTEKTKDNKPTYGVIQDRMNGNPLEFRDPKGKPVVPYGNVMEKLNITKEQAIAAASKLGLTIPEEQFEVKKAKRGRPKKDTAVEDTASEASVEPKKRGRPKKEKEVVTDMAPGDDLIATLVENAKKTINEDKKQIEKKEVSKASSSKDPPPVSDKEEDEDDDEEEIVVTRFNHKGVEYLRATDNVLYNKESEVVGIWDEDTQTILPHVDLDDDDD